MIGRQAILEGITGLCYDCRRWGKRYMPGIPKRKVEISIQGPYKGRLSRQWIRNVAYRALDVALPGETCQLSLMIADDDTVKYLNREYRGLDEVTDVLSFSSYHQGHWEGEGTPPVGTGDDVPFVLPPGEPQHLGEVVISYPQVERQAVAGSSSMEREMALIIVHGILHLIGFDHVEPLEETDMQAKEREILSSII